MAVTKYPWLPPDTTMEQAQAEAMRIMRARCRRFGRRHDITAWVEDAYIDELRRYPRRSRKAGATWIDDTPIASNAIFYRIIVVQKVKAREQPWWQRQRLPGGV
jgi:hypothetical protein